MYNDLKENWSYNEWPDVDLNGNIVEKKSLKESVGISPKRRRVVVDGQEEFDGSKFVKDLNEDLSDVAKKFKDKILNEDEFGGLTDTCEDIDYEFKNNKITELDYNELREYALDQALELAWDADYLYSYVNHALGDLIRKYASFADIPKAELESVAEFEVGRLNDGIAKEVIKAAFKSILADEYSRDHGDDFDEALNIDKKYGKPDLSKYKNSKDIIKPDMSTKEKVCPDCGKKVCECGELKECGEVNEDLLNAKVSPKRGRVIVDGQTDFDGSKFVKDLNEAKKKEDKPENIKDCLMAALDEIEVPEDEELDPKKVLDAIADCLDDEAREYLCGILCPEEKEEEAAEAEVEEEPLEDIEVPAEDEVVEEDLTPAEQKEKEAIEGPMGVVRHADEARYNELVALEKDHSRKV